MIVSQQQKQPVLPHPHPPHLSFGASTLSFLYSNDLRLLEVRKVPVDKMFSLNISATRMQFIHDQVHIANMNMN